MVDRVQDERGLRSRCETAFNVRLSSVHDIDEGASSRNFVAEEVGGRRFLIKVVADVATARLLTARFRLLDGINGVRCLFDGKVLEFEGRGVFALSYCDGKEIHFEDYTSSRISELLAFYRKFSELIQTATDTLDVYDLVSMRGAIESDSKRTHDRAVLGFLDEMPVEALTYRPEKTRVIHGDFHYANFRFGPEGVAGVFDLRDFRTAYPADDMVRLVLCSAERMRWYKWLAYRRLFRNFGELVRRSGYPQDEWLVAINGYFIRKLYKRFKRHRRIGFWMRLNLRMRAVFYRRFRTIVAESCLRGRES